MKVLNLFYVTYDGVKSLYCGVGSDTQIMLSSLDDIKESVKELGYDLKLHILYAEVPKEVQAYSEEVFNMTKNKIKNKNIDLYELKQGHYVSNPFGGLDTWEVMCSRAKEIIEGINGDDIGIIIANDTPFAKLCEIFEGNENILVVWRTASTQKVWDHSEHKVDQRFIEWEYYAANGANKSNNIFIGANCDFMKSHMIDCYGVNEEKIIPLTNGISKDYFNDNIVLSQDEIEKLLIENGIPTDKKLFISFGRAAWYKGLDIACNVSKVLSKELDDVYFLVFASDFGIKESSDYVEYLKEIFTLDNSKGRLFTEYKFDLPQKLMQWKNTRTVGVFSRREPFGSIPSEVRTIGPDKVVVVATNAGGLKEQIIHGVDGYSVNPMNLEEIIDSCRISLTLSELKAKEMNDRAKEKVEKDYIFYKNITQTISQAINKSGLMEEK